MTHAITSPSRLRVVALMLVVLAVFSSSYGQVETDLTRLQGYWVSDGEDQTYTITIKGNRLDYYGRENFWTEASFTLPVGTNPAQLRATIVNDASPSSIGSVVTAIYKLEGDSLTLAINQDNEAPPPQSFSNNPNSAVAQYHLKRGEPPAAEAERAKPQPE